MYVEDPGLVLAGKHVHGSGNAVVARRLAHLERIEDDRRAQEDTCIDGIEFADHLADVHDPAVGAHDPRHIVQIIDRAGDVEIHGERDGIRLGSRGHQIPNNGRIDQMIAHAQQKRTVQKRSRLRDGDAIAALPLVVIHVPDWNSFPVGKRVERCAHIFPPVAAHHQEALDAGASGTRDDALEQPFAVYRDQRLALSPLSQAPPRPGGDNEADQGTTALSFAVLLRMKVSTMS